MSIFERYAPFIQDFIYQNDWESLRAIQVAAGDAIFNTDENVLLSASTASGKTEAAFFPILTQFYEDPPTSVGAIYIGPLKALINDQFLRLNDLCAEAGIPVWHWHGDVSQSHKAKMLKHPSGILQITPESLEAMLLHKHAALTKLFHDLRYIVIDEVHSLMRGDRGGQTICLMERLCRMAGVNPRRIGLSATIGDLEATGAFLAAGTGRGTVIPRIESKGVRWRLSMEHFYVQDQQAAAEHLPEQALPELAPKTDTAPAHADPGIGYIFEHTRGKKCLVFVNSREECEAVTTTLRQYCEARHEPDRFLIHHGNLSSAYRETAETAMKDDDLFLTTVTTATLELGIDIGRLERAFQVDAPFTVSSFLQRMGRTGRRDLPPEMWFVIREDPPEARALLPTTIPWKLLQGIALVQVYLEERWVEPPRLDRLPYSLLYHQTMCTLASCGEMTPAALASRVLTLSYFHRVSQEDFKLLLRHLLEIDHIQRTETGGLIVGIAGERLTSSYKFYAVFQENVEYTVRWNSQELGTIVQPPPGGRKDRHCRSCLGGGRDRPQAAHGILRTDQGQSAGVLRRMPRRYPHPNSGTHETGAAGIQAVSLSHAECGGTITAGTAHGAELRADGRAADLSGRRYVVSVPLAGDVRLSRHGALSQDTLRRIPHPHRLSPSRPYFIQFKMKADKRTFFQVLLEQERKPLDPMELVYPKEIPMFEKYDEYLPDILIKKGFACGVLGIDEMRERIRSWEKYT